MVRFKGRGRGGGRGSGLGAVWEDTIGRGDDSRFTGDEGHLSKHSKRQDYMRYQKISVMQMI